MKQRVYGVEFRKRRKGLNKNKLPRRWSRWVFIVGSLQVHRPLAEQRVRDFLGLDSLHYIETEARIIVFDRRKTKPATFRDVSKMLKETFK
jgi:hypothetical protein